MSNNPLVSIIVPIHNADRYLEKCLDSILKQSYVNLELILIDDGSTDESGAICDLYASKDRRIKVFHTNNSGVSKARNLGLKVFTGEYVGFVDADDYVDDNMYLKLISSVDNELIDIVQCGYCLVTESHLVTQYLVNKEFYGGMVCVPDLFEPNKIISNCIWNKVFKKDLIRHIQFDENIAIGEDLKFVIEACLGAKRIKLIDYAGYYYCFRTDSAMSSPFTRKRFDDFKVNDWCLDVFKNEKSIRKYVSTRDAKNCVDYYYLSSGIPHFQTERKMIRQRLRSDRKRFFLGIKYELSIISILLFPRFFSFLCKRKFQRVCRK